MLAWSFVRNVGMSVVGVAAAALALANVTACVVQSEPGSYSDGSGGSGGTGTGSSSGGSGGSPQPMLVDVDPDRTMNATPGQGVGVFVEYKTGGHWNVWWTCDTNKSGQSCAFDNVITVSTGSITNLAGQQPGASPSASQDSPQKIEAITTTTTGIDGVTFDTPFSAGQTPVITLTVTLNGVQSVQSDCQSGGSCNDVFFVQDGAIDGNYQGSLTESADARAPHAVTLRAVVGFGSNLGDRLATLRAARRLLEGVARVEATSRVYATAPVGPPQPDFLNAAALVAYEGSPGRLMEALLDIEARLGRVRAERNGPRTLDLDLLWIDGLRVESPQLVVPHPRLAERAFALAPMMEARPRRDRSGHGDGVRGARRRRSRHGRRALSARR